jgi:hypothetical protein
LLLCIPQSSQPTRVQTRRGRCRLPNSLTPGRLVATHGERQSFRKAGRPQPPEARAGGHDTGATQGPLFQRLFFWYEGRSHAGLCVCHRCPVWQRCRRNRLLHVHVPVLCTPRPITARRSDGCETRYPGPRGITPLTAHQSVVRRWATGRRGACNVGGQTTGQLFVSSNRCASLRSIPESVDFVLTTNSRACRLSQLDDFTAVRVSGICYGGGVLVQARSSGQAGYPRPEIARTTARNGTNKNTATTK